MVVVEVLGWLYLPWAFVASVLAVLDVVPHALPLVAWVWVFVRVVVLPLDMELEVVVVSL